jgi:SAM-dependent methyltransferase
MTDQLYTKDWLEFYDKMSKEEHYRRTFKIMMHFIKKYVPKAKDILELGCGTGRYTVYFLKEKMDVKGTDISPDAIAVAKKRAPRAKFEVSDMAKVHETQIYDVVTCMYEVFRYNHSLAACMQTIRNTYAALRPGGIFLCDFGVFPGRAAGEKVTLHNEVKISGGRLVVKDEEISSKGHFAYRKDKVKVYKKSLFGKPRLVMEDEIKRDPLIILEKDTMLDMLKKAGFTKVEVIDRFYDDSPYHLLFIAQRP